jgi:polysaccharide deacetylase family protein (PEP-CTERM system associated)
MTKSLSNVLCVDLEDYFHAHLAKIPREDWDRCERRVAVGTRRLLGVLDRHGVRATFFVVGYSAERDPELVRALGAAGHEVASHSYAHRMLSELGPAEFRADLRRSLDVLQAITGRRVLGFRAPSWSLTDRTGWAEDVLLAEGLKYDSSRVPWRGFLHVRGSPGAPPIPHRTACGLVEFPAPVCRIAGLAYPFSLATAFRLTPYAALAGMVRRFPGRHGSPVMISLHPGDFDPGQPRAARAPLSRLLQYAGIRGCAAKLDRLLGDFPFGRMDEALRNMGLLTDETG